MLIECAGEVANGPSARVPGRPHPESAGGICGTLIEYA